MAGPSTVPYARHVHARVGLVAASLFGLLACGGEPGTAVDTGLPATRALADLPQQEAARVCRSYWEALAKLMPPDRRARVSCERFAASASSSLNSITGLYNHDRERCEQRVEECVYARSEPDPSPAERCDGLRTSMILADCEATVADYERCADSVLAEIDWRASHLTCEAYGDGSEGGLQLEQNLAEVRDARDSACHALEQACPSLRVLSDGGLVQVEQTAGAR
jgi:hypothetical protein